MDMRELAINIVKVDVRSNNPNATLKMLLQDLKI